MSEPEHCAVGTFTVKLSSLEKYAESSGQVALGRLSVDKEYTGDLGGIGQGEMLNAISPVQGSAGYVAIEQVIGTLSGKQGSFVLQHYGVMDKGKDRLVLEVVPDSGTGELAGLYGCMEIRITSGVHHYELKYGFF